MAKISRVAQIDWDEVEVSDGSEGLNVPNVVPFKPSWELPAARFVGAEQRLPAPILDVEDLLPDTLTVWVKDAAESKGCPLDYVFWGMMAVAASSIGNARTASPWANWEEPSILWPMLVGLPSAGKSPGLDAALSVLREIERDEWNVIKPELDAWMEKKGLAEVAASAHRELTKVAIKNGDPAPDAPEEMRLGPKPVLPRVIVNDGTIEKVAQIAGNQPDKPCLLFRDELSGWLASMERYSAGTDRSFWLEAYGARPFTVERMGREGDRVDRLAISVVGGIQPGKLDEILIASADDGLLARLIPVLPEPIDLSRPRASPDDRELKAILNRLRALEMHKDDAGRRRPFVCEFDEEGADILHSLRQHLRELEGENDGFMLSFLGKLPGLAVRLSLVLQALDDAVSGDVLTNVKADNVKRACRLVMSYLVPMAERTYRTACVPHVDRMAFKLLDWCKRTGRDTFTVRDVTRADLAGLRTAAEANPVVSALEDAGAIRPVDAPANRKGGRPRREYEVNPKALSK